MESKVWRLVRIWRWNFEVFAFSKFWMSDFCPERSHPLKNRRLEGGAGLNRPSRFQRSHNFWNLFVFGGSFCPKHHLAQIAPLTGTTGERGKRFDQSETHPKIFKMSRNWIWNYSETGVWPKLIKIIIILVLSIRYATTGNSPLQITLKWKNWSFEIVIFACKVRAGCVQKLHFGCVCVCGDLIMMPLRSIATPSSWL